jgi:hypothetical protein
MEIAATTHPKLTKRPMLSPDEYHAKAVASGSAGKMFRPADNPNAKSAPPLSREHVERVVSRTIQSYEMHGGKAPHVSQMTGMLTKGIINAYLAYQRDTDLSSGAPQGQGSTYNRRA